jgi:hypothetical protein
MQIRRPIAALMTALALFGGGATLTACADPAGANRNDGSTDVGGSTNSSGNPGNLPNNSDPQNGSEDQNDDAQDPD